MESVVISVGGSVLVPGNNDAEFIKKLVDLIRTLSKEYRLCIVCGGGKIARYYISVGRSLGMSREEQDELGIMVTRLNAKLLQNLLKDIAAPCIPATPREASVSMSSYPVVIMGGTMPGHTTDAVAAMVAREFSSARIVNATSVDAVYSADPKEVRTAVKFQKLTFKELIKLVDKGDHQAGPSNVFDKLGAQLAMESNIPIYIVNGRDLEDLRHAIRGEKIRGTIVSG